MIHRGRPLSWIRALLSKLKIAFALCTWTMVLAAFDDIMREALSDLVGSSLSDWKGLPPKFSGRSESVSSSPLCSCYLYLFPVPV